MPDIASKEVIASFIYLDYDIKTLKTTISGTDIFSFSTYEGRYNLFNRLIKNGWEHLGEVWDISDPDHTRDIFRKDICEPLRDLPL